MNHYPIHTGSYIDSVLFFSFDPLWLCEYDWLPKSCNFWYVTTCQTRLVLVLYVNKHHKCYIRDAPASFLIFWHLYERMDGVLSFSFFEWLREEKKTSHYMKMMIHFISCHPVEIVIPDHGVVVSCSVSFLCSFSSVTLLPPLSGREQH